MRVCLLLVLTTALLFTTYQPAAAQRTQTTAASERPPAGLHFRARSVQERLAATQRVIANQRQRGGAPAQVAPNTDFSDRFVLTPRALYVAGQGSMSFNAAAGVVTAEEPSGYAWFRAVGDPGSLRIQISNPARRRLLIECTVSSTPADTFTGRLTAPGQPQIWTDVSEPAAGVISFLTPPLASNAATEFEFLIRKTDYEGIWHFMGCEVTRLALP